jgi:hypothetical protein
VDATKLEFTPRDMNQAFNAAFKEMESVEKSLKVEGIRRLKIFAGLRMDMNLGDRKVATCFDGFWF